MSSLRAKRGNLAVSGRVQTEIASSSAGRTPRNDALGGLSWMLLCVVILSEAKNLDFQIPGTFHSFLWRLPATVSYTHLTLPTSDLV